MSEIKITAKNFDEVVLRSAKPVLVDFWATWCGPCMMQGEVLKEMAKKYAGEFIIGKINVDDEMELAMQFGVQSIPTLLVFREGKVVAKTIGFSAEEELLKMIRR